MVATMPAQSAHRARSDAADGPVPLWLSTSALGGGVGFALLASAGAPPMQAIALLTGAAAAGGLGLYGFAERLATWRRRSRAATIDDFAALLEAAPEPTALVDRSGRIRAMNAAARRLWASDGSTLPPTRAEDLLTGVEDAKAIVFKLLRDALSGQQAERSVAAAQGAPLRLTVWPAGPGLALWRQTAERRPAAERPATVEEAALSAATLGSVEGQGDAEIAWFRIGAKGRISASNDWFERWIAGGPAEASCPSFHTVFPDAAAQLQAGGAVDGLVERTRMISGPAGPRTVSLMLAPSLDGSGAAGLAIRKAGVISPPLASSARAASAIEALDSARLFEDAPIGVMVLSAQGRILQLNAAADRLLTADMQGRPSAGAETPGVEPLGARLVDWAHPEDQADVAERLATASQGAAGAGPAFEARLMIGGPGRVKKAGGTDWRATQCLFSRVDVGEHRMLVGFLIDASEQRGLERTFVQGQRLQAVGQLAGGIAHDFNNLLTVILGCCESLLVRHTVDDPDYAELSDIDQSAQRAARLVKQLLAFSRRQHLAPETANLTELVSDLSSMLNRLIGESIALQQDLAEDVWPVRVDIGQFQQVITNLVVNARDAMEGEGGRILIRTANERADSERPGLNFAMPPGEYVRIDVSDTGCGMPPSVIEKIFDPYFTTKDIDKGTGLGLATVYGIIKQTGGYIFVDSEVGQGTTFQIFLPRLKEEAEPMPFPDAPLTGVAGAERFEALFDAGGLAATPEEPAPRAPQAEPAPVQEATSAPKAAGGGLDDLLSAADDLFGESDVKTPAAPKPEAPTAPASRSDSAGGRAAQPPVAASDAVVLLVEDETAVRSLFARHLRGRGYTVLEAEDGEEALEILERPEQTIHLMVSDVMMPGMDGPTMLRKLGDRRPELRVVFMSGFTSDAFAETIERALETPRVFGFLQKPFSLADLASKVAAELAAV